MTPRHVWFKSRIDECLKHLVMINTIEDWEQYKDSAHILACELLYATTEWDKYHRQISKDI